MPFSDENRAVVTTCSDQQREQAFDLLLSAYPPQDRAQVVSRLLLTASDIQLKGLFGAYRDGQLYGVIWAQPQSGATAVLWPPRLIESAPPNDAEALLVAAVAHCRAIGSHLIQSMLATDASPEAERLKRFGFTHLADLMYLVSHRVQFPDSPPATELEFVSYDDSQYQRLASLIEATYLHSLDCPSLDGVRSLDDVIAGYRTTGAYAPARWLFVRHADRDVGCLLLADHPEDDQWELVYMGVIPTARGNGLGTAIARHAQWLAHAADRARLVLAVDAANRPAVDTYAEAGFIAWDRRSAFVLLCDRMRTP